MQGKTSHVPQCSNLKGLPGPHTLTVCPASNYEEHQLVLHEPTSTEAPEAEDIPTADPLTAEDIGHHDNVEDDEVLPQIAHQLVSTLVITNSELISIGRPLTTIAQDASWADHPQDTPSQDTPSTPPPQVTTLVLDDDNSMVKTTPSPKASPAFCRLRKGPRPQVTMPSIPEGEVQHNSVAHQVFHDATPTANVSESEAKAVEDIPAASAEDNQ